MLPDAILPTPEDDIARQLTRLEKKVESLERLEIAGGLAQSEFGVVNALSVLRTIHDDFWGDVIDARWNTTVAGSAIAATLQTDSPSRVLLDTGATISSESTLDEGAFFHWAASDNVTFLFRAKISHITDIGTFLILFNSGPDFLGWRFQTSTDLTWHVISVGGGGTTLTDTGIVPDTNYHWFAISLQPGQVSFKQDGGAIFTHTTNVSAADLRMDLRVSNRVAASRRLECDAIILIPGLAAF